MSLAHQLATGWDFYFVCPAGDELEILARAVRKERDFTESLSLGVSHREHYN